MVSGEFVVQWLHIIVSIFWFGSVMFTDFVLMPGIGKMATASQLDFGVNVGSRISKIMTPAASLAIVLGIVRGLLFGDIKDVNALFGTTYGLAWLVALAAAVATFAWGLFMISPAVEKISKPTTTPEAAAAGIARIKTLVMIELVGFLVIFTMMIVMHFAGES